MAITFRFSGTAAGPWRQVIDFDEMRMLQRTGGVQTATDTNDLAYQAVRPRGP